MLNPEQNELPDQCLSGSVNSLVGVRHSFPPLDGMFFSSHGHLFSPKGKHFEHIQRVPKGTFTVELMRMERFRESSWSGC